MEPRWGTYIAGGGLEEPLPTSGSFSLVCVAVDNMSGQLPAPASCCQAFPPFWTLPLEP